jgi:hypothetical protein
VGEGNTRVHVVINGLHSDGVATAGP